MPPPRLPPDLKQLATDKAVAVCFWDTKSMYSRKQALLVGKLFNERPELAKKVQVVGALRCHVGDDAECQSFVKLLGELSIVFLKGGDVLDEQDLGPKLTEQPPRGKLAARFAAEQDDFL